MISCRLSLPFILRASCCIVSLLTAIMCFWMLRAPVSNAGGFYYGRFQAENATVSSGTWTTLTGTESASAVGLGTNAVVPSRKTTTGGTLLGTIVITQADIDNATAFAVQAVKGSTCTSSPGINASIRQYVGHGADREIVVTPLIGSKITSTAWTTFLLPLTAAARPGGLGDTVTITLSISGASSTCPVFVDWAGYWQLGLTESTNPSRTTIGASSVDWIDRSYANNYYADSPPLSYAVTAFKFLRAGGGVAIPTTRSQPIYGQLVVYAALDAPDAYRDSEGRWRTLPTDYIVSSSQCSTTPKIRVTTPSGYTYDLTVNFAGWHRYTLSDPKGLLKGSTKVTYKLLLTGSGTESWCAAPLLDFAHATAR